MFKRTSDRKLVLIIDPERVAWVRCDDDGSNSRILATAQLPRTVESASADNARAVAEAAVACRPKDASGEVAVALPTSWCEYLILAPPPLRGLDRTSYLLREVTKKSSLPIEDVTFIEFDPRGRSTSALDKASKARGKSYSRLVIATKEGPILALSEALASKGFIATSITAGAAAPLACELKRAGARTESDANEALQVVFLVRRDGFAICLHAGGEVIQIRVVAVDLPSDIDLLADTIAEETRRSTVSAREKHWSRKLGRVRVLGRFAGNREELQRSVEAKTGLQTTLADSMDSESDRLEEAASIAALHGSATMPLDLLPKHTSRPTLHIGRIALAGGLSGVLLAGLIGVSHVIDEDSDNTQAYLDRSTDAGLASERAQSECGDYLRRVDLVAGFQKVVASLQENHLDAGRIVRALASVIGPDCQVTRLSCSSLVGGQLSIRVTGRFIDSFWPYETNLERLVGDLRRISGLSFTAITDEAIQFNEEYQDFVLEAQKESSDESTHP